MFRVLLTGGIASGKSAASAYFESLGVAVIDADRVSRELVQPGQPALAQIVAQFGEDMLTPGGELNRQALRQRVFADPAERKRLEGILHPLIRERMQEQAEQARSPYVLLVVPLFVETGKSYPCERVLLIDTAEATQRQRLTTRDGSSDQQVQQLLAAQAGRTARIDAADDVISNNGSLEELQAALGALHQRYVQMARGGRVR